MVPGADDDPVTAVEEALLALVRHARLSPVHEKVSADTGIRLDRAGYLTLARIADLEPVKLSLLAERLGVDRSTASRQVHDLREMELVEAEADPRDGRAAFLSLSRAGRALLRRVRAERHAAYEAAMAGWSDAERTDLAMLLTRLADDVHKLRTR
jgi:DNA-binding MarR family transcriptional regulator